MEAVKVFFALLTLASLSIAAPYGMADLQKLEAERSFAEFFLHAHDILPSGRTPEWNTLVETMGEAYLRQLKAKNRLQPGDFRQMEKLMGWPVLARNEFFRQLRGEIGLQWFSQCLSKDSGPTSACWNDLQGFWEKGRQDPDLAVRLYATVSPFLSAESPVEGSLLLAPMLKSPLAGLQCQKPAIAGLVWEEARKFAPEDFTRSQTALAHASCWSALLPLAQARFTKGSAMDELALARRLLQSKAALSEAQEDVFLVAYLLSTPIQGDDFNLAWNRLIALGKSAPRRERTGRTLRGWQPLPGDIFASSDAKKKTIVARHFRRYFPEYLDLYALTCVDFYGARRRFPEGNPAHHCRPFFQLAREIPELVPEATRTSFEKALK